MVELYGSSIVVPRSSSARVKPCDKRATAREHSGDAITCNKRAESFLENLGTTVLSLVTEAWSHTCCAPLRDSPLEVSAAFGRSCPAVLVALVLELLHSHFRRVQAGHRGRDGVLHGGRNLAGPKILGGAKSIFFRPPFHFFPSKTVRKIFLVVFWRRKERALYTYIYSMFVTQSKNIKK